MTENDPAHWATGEPSADEYCPPIADNFDASLCINPTCEVIHVLLYDATGRGIAQATFTYEQLQRMVAMVERRILREG